MAPLSNIDNVYGMGDGVDHVCSMDDSATSFPLHEKPAQQRKCVSFAETNTTQYVLNLEDYSVEEKQSSWYSKEEIRVIKDETKALASQTAEESDGNADCLRGLEARSASGARRKRQNKKEARSAVFYEQEMQEEEGICDPDAIADVYSECAEICQAEAQMMGLRDQRESMKGFESFKLSDIEYSYGRLVVLREDVIGYGTGSPAA